MLLLTAVTLLILGVYTWYIPGTWYLMYTYTTACRRTSESLVRVRDSGFREPRSLGSGGV